MKGKEIIEKVEEAKYIVDQLSEQTTQTTSEGRILLPYKTVTRMINLCNDYINFIKETHFRK